MHCCTDAYIDFPYTSPLLSGVLRVSGEAGTSTHKPQMNYLQWADVVVASTKLIKPAETHHFIWRFLFFGLALICWLLPALWLGRWVKGGEALCLMLTVSKQNSHPLPYVLPSDTPGWVEVSKRIQLQADVRSSAVDYRGPSICWRPAVYTVHTCTPWTTYGHAKP